MSARVLVTGGAGFIGSELVRQLVERGDDVVVLDNLATGRRENLEGLACRLVEADLRDEAETARLLSGQSVVYHLACLGVRHSIAFPRENHEVNAAATLALLVAARAAGVARFVHVSTSEVYGTARSVPMKEEHPTFPSTVYGASKLAGESYARAFHDCYGFPAVVIRPFNTYGPRSHHEGDSGEVIPKFMLRRLSGRPLVIFGDGDQTRDFTYVSDTAAGILAAGAAPGIAGETINLGSGAEISINALAREVAEVAGAGSAEIRHDPERPGDVRRLYADPSRARTLLGFEPKVAFRAGLLRLRDWYASLGRAPEELLEEEIVHNWKPREPARRG